MRGTHVSADAVKWSRDRVARDVILWSEAISVVLAVAAAVAMETSEELM